MPGLGSEIKINDQWITQQINYIQRIFREIWFIWWIVSLCSCLPGRQSMVDLSYRKNLIEAVLIICNRANVEWKFCDFAPDILLLLLLLLLFLLFLLLCYDFVCFCLCIVSRGHSHYSHTWKTISVLLAYKTNTCTLYKLTSCSMRQT